MGLISVDDALRAICSGAARLPEVLEDVGACDGLVLAANLHARRNQPPFAASSMDGYAVRRANVKNLPTELAVVGEAAAGRGWAGTLTDGQAVRIFTGAPVPAGADAIVIQENTKRSGDTIGVTSGTVDAGHIRPLGFDFTEGDHLLDAGIRLAPRTLTLAAAMGYATLSVVQKPKIAIIATGDELVLPGAPTGPDQIVCSNPFGVAAIANRAGGITTVLGIARDTEAHLNAMLDRADDADIVVTIGGASVGDHDLVGPVLRSRGVALDFWKVAMRPGKPLMFGRDQNRTYLGLPGNPVSSLVCSRVFLVPLIHAMLGLSETESAPQMLPLANPIEANGPRTHYMRAVTERVGGAVHVRPVNSQDSSLLTRLAQSDALIVRSPNAPAASLGETVAVLPLDF